MAEVQEKNGAGGVPEQSVASVSGDLSIQVCADDVLVVEYEVLRLVALDDHIAMVR